MNAYSPILIFSGEVVKASVRGEVVTATCVPGGTQFERRVPRMRIHAACNHALYSVGCGIQRSALEFGAVVDEVAEEWPWEVTIGSITRAAGPIPDLDAHWFAGGLLRSESGEDFRIVDSSEIEAGKIVVVPRRKTSVEETQTVLLWPGCDGRMETCKGKFDNWLNFGGHPFCPIGNPSLIKVSPAISGGKK